MYSIIVTNIYTIFKNIIIINVYDLPGINQAFSYMLKKKLVILIT